MGQNFLSKVVDFELSMSPDLAKVYALLHVELSAMPSPPTG